MHKTKESILLTALRLFAQDGYEAVSTSMIAGELGMTKGALYKHYKNKQDIFDSIIARIHETDQELSRIHGVPSQTYDVAPHTYRNVSIEEDMKYTKKYFHFWTQDEFGRNFRKMLTLEQYRNPDATKEYEKVLSTGLFEYSVLMFREWMNNGIIEEDNPELLAIEFCGAFHFLISLSDNMPDVKHLESLLDAYIKRFLRKNMIKELI